MKSKTFSLSGIAFGNLRRRKRQYVTLVMTVFFAVYFATSSLLLGFGIYTTLRERHLARYGNQDDILFNCGGVSLDELMADGTLRRIGKASILAEVVAGDSEEDCFCIAQYDDEALALANKRLKEGEFPGKAGEIALEQSALARLGIDAKVGDTINLTLRIPDGTGFLKDPVEKTWRLTGILNDQLVYWDFLLFERVYFDIPAGVLSTSEAIEPGGRAVMLAYAAYADGSAQAKQRLGVFYTQKGVSILQKPEFVFGFSEDVDALIAGICFVTVALLLLMTCCLGIVNAFSANLDARRKQIGLLRAVGATQLQIRQIFARETLLLAAASIPAALAAAILTVILVFSLLGEDYALALNGYVLLGAAIFSIACILLAARIPLRRASAISPMQAIREEETLRRIGKAKIHSKVQFNAPKLIAWRSLRIYKTRRAGISAMLAAGTILFTLTFLYMTAMYRELLASKSGADYRLFDGSYNYRIWDSQMIYGYHNSGFSEKEKAEAASLPLVKTVAGQKMLTVKLLIDKITPYATADGWMREFRYLSPDIPTYDSGYDAQDYVRANNEYRQVKDRYGYDTDYLSVTTYGWEESLISLLEKYVYEGEIRMDRLHSGEEILLIAPEQYKVFYTQLNNGYGIRLGSESASEALKKEDGTEEKIVYSDENDMFHAGDPLKISLLYTDEQEQQHDDEGNLLLPANAVRIDRTVQIGALLKIPDDAFQELVSFYNSGFLNVVTTNEGLSALGFNVPYSLLSVTLSKEPDTQTAGILHKELNRIAYRISDGRMNSNLENAWQQRRIVIQLTAIAAVLCMLAAALTASMANNTLTAHIRANRRSIGTQRAVGASGRVIFQSYLYRVFSLFLWGGGIGYALSVAAGTWVIKSWPKVFLEQSLPLWQPLVFIALLMAICTLNVWLRLRGILCESIAENIREL